MLLLTYQSTMCWLQTTLVSTGWHWPCYNPGFSVRDAVTSSVVSGPFRQVGRCCFDAPIDWGTLAADMVRAGTITWASVALATHWDDKVGRRPDVNFCSCSHAHDHRSNLPLQSSTLPV